MLQTEHELGLFPEASLPTTKIHQLLVGKAWHTNSAKPKQPTKAKTSKGHYSNVAVTKAIYCVFPLHHHTVRCTVRTWVTAQSGTRGLPRIKCFQTTWSWSLETNVWGGRIWLAQQEMLQLHAYWSFLPAMLVPEGTDCIFAIFLEYIYIL